MFKFEVNFVNLSHRDPHRKNIKLKNVRRDSAFAPLERAVGLERAWERVCFAVARQSRSKGRRRFVSRTPFLSQKFSFTESKFFKFLYFQDAGLGDPNLQI